MRQTIKQLPVAIVTGASSGFGLLTSVALAREGYKVIATMRNLDKSEKLLTFADQAHVSSQIEMIELDVTDVSRIEVVIKDLIHRFGRINLLVNNAGYAAGGFTEELQIDEWRRQFDVNFFGMVAVTKEVLPYMREQRSGKVINISSISGRVGFPAMGPYAASKFAVEGFSESLRLELLRYGIYVVLIEPGSYKTDIWSKGLKSISLPSDSAYSKEMKEIIKHVELNANTAPAPDEVIEQIVKVASMSAPKLRYPIGKGVKAVLMFKQIIPWKWWERLVTNRLNL
ncbi:oxidoreductase [Bacillus sp. Marseille-P3661]|uniref:oxidoreductase n=1 Tax=Bacillus sp. Marseille-P3661 TaxID=1936234 RepID=UPI000C83B071|nr:oxidoreductase [Bacillus sp. Marseille-P3661]